MKRLIVWIPACFIIALAGVLAIALSSPRSMSHDPLYGKALPDIQLAPFPGQADFNPKAVQGPYLINVWASWCTPCQVEHPLLMQLAQNDIPIYGIVYKDQRDDADQFLTLLGNPFTGQGMDLDGRAGIELGLTGAPETFLIDNQGLIRARWRGPLTPDLWNQNFADLWVQSGGVPVILGSQ